MKHVISISLGSSLRDGSAKIHLGDVACRVERIGTDGDKEKMLALFKKHRADADAFGLGGTDLYLQAGGKRYTFRESLAFVRAAWPVPVFDGSGLKDTLERQVVYKLWEEGRIDLTRARVLLVCGVDRFGMAETFWRLGSDLICGDLMFGLSLPLPIRCRRRLDFLTQLIAPVVTRLPIRWLYPVGKAQEIRRPRFGGVFSWADIIAGDFHFIRRYMPERLPGKIVVTNTVTAADRHLLRAAGVRLLVTTTPCYDGRSFGTNVLEAAIWAATRKCGDAAELEEAVACLDLRPGIFFLQDE